MHFNRFQTLPAQFLLIQFQIKLMRLHLVVLSSTSKARSNTCEYFLLISLFIILVKSKYNLSVSSVETTREQTSLVLKLKGKISIAFKVLWAKKSNVFVLVTALAKSYNFLHHFFMKGFQAVCGLHLVYSNLSFKLWFLLLFIMIHFITVSHPIHLHSFFLHIIQHNLRTVDNFIHLCN